LRKGQPKPLWSLGNDVWLTALSHCLSLYSQSAQCKLKVLYHVVLK